MKPKYTMRELMSVAILVATIAVMSFIVGVAYTTHIITETVKDAIVKVLPKNVAEAGKTAEAVTDGVRAVWGKLKQ